MLCTRPFRVGATEYGCGGCYPCRINRKRVWTARLMLESKLHEASCFVTLTFDDRNLPGDFSVDPRDVQLFLKRLRDRLSPSKIRYYAVGEYGDVSSRPHYHVILFGYDPRDHVKPFGNKQCYCNICLSWSFGAVDVGTLTEASAGYTCGYLLKGMTGKNDERLKGRKPEFARMSLKPGIGGDATHEISEYLTGKIGSGALVSSGDVPYQIGIGGVNFPIGRYLRQRVRSGVGWKPSAPPDVSLVSSLRNVERIKAVGGPEKWSEKRKQDAKRAEYRIKFFKSKRGIGQ